MKQHFVTFFSPGTFVSETSTKPIDSWDVAKATEMARGISERYNATPYGFQFSTRERGDNDLDSHEIAESNVYYLGGDIVTIEEIRERNDPDERTLLWNMEVNKLDRVLVNCNSWKITLPLTSDAIVLEWGIDAAS